MRIGAFLLLVIGLNCSQAIAQVVNMETRRLHTDSVRKAGEFNLAFLYNNTNNNPLITFRGNAVVQVKSKNYKNLWMLAGSYDLAKAEDADFVNASFLHLRYNRVVNKWLRWEAYSQIQANQPLGIQFRWLTGTGPRIKCILGKNASLYMGAAYMYEHEETRGAEQRINRDHRSSNYASVSFTIPSLKGDIVSSTYWQPLFNDISDYRLTNDTRIDFRITGHFRVYTRFNYFYDSQPPENIRKIATSFEQGFGISF